MNLRLLLIAAVMSAAGFPAFVRADDPPAAAPADEDAPRIFLDKNPRIVAYQLRRLSNAQLMALERHDNDPKYKPIYEALLTRSGLEKKYRQEALDALTKLNHSDAVSEILAAVQNADPQDKGSVRELVALLMAQPPAALAAQRQKI